MRRWLTPWGALWTATWRSWCWWIVYSHVFLGGAQWLGAVLLSGSCFCPSEGMNTQSSSVSSCISLWSETFLPFHSVLVLTAGGGNTSGAWPVATLTSARCRGPNVDQKRDEASQRCWAPVRSRWWRNPWLHCAALRSSCMPPEPATRSCVSSRASLTSTSSQRAAPLSGTPVLPTPCSEPSGGEWWTWVRVCSLPLKHRMARQNWPITSLKLGVKELPAGPTREAWWRIETVLSSTASWQLWKGSCCKECIIKWSTYCHIYDHINVFLW